MKIEGPDSEQPTPGRRPRRTRRAAHARVESNEAVSAQFPARLTAEEASDPEFQLLMGLVAAELESILAVREDVLAAMGPEPPLGVKTVSDDDLAMLIMKELHREYLEDRELGLLGEAEGDYGEDDCEEDDLEEDDDEVGKG